MHSDRPGQVTLLLQRLRSGDSQGTDRLVPLVFQELRGLARCYLKGERPSHTLQPRGLINEAYLCLIEWETVGWQNRSHFYAAAAKMMRHIPVNQALARKREKRGAEAVWFRSPKRTDWARPRLSKAF